MSSINAKLGLKSRTRIRRATHGSGLVSGAQCPTCACHHVVEHDVHERPLRLCGFCGETWEPIESEIEGELAGNDDDQRDAA